MTTENHDELPESLCFEADGHVTDVVLTCLADGEISILPAAAMAHVDACDACTSRLGVEALLSVNATDALAAAAAPRVTAAAMPAITTTWPTPSRPPSSLSPSSRKRRPLPIGAIAAALCVAVLGALPSLVDSWSTLRTVVPDYIHALPIWSHAIEAVLKGMMQTRGGSVLRWITAAAFIGAGTLLARATTRKRVLEGGLG